MSKLTPNQQRFVDEYLVDLNATQAAIRAGYSAKTAHVQGTRLLGIARVSEAVAEAQKEREQRTRITADRVLQELARIAFFDPRKAYNEDGSVKPIPEMDDDTAAAVAGFEVNEVNSGGDSPVGVIKKIRFSSKDTAITLAMRHLGMLRDKVDVTSNGETVGTGVLVVPAAMSEAEWEKQQGE